MYSRVSQPLTRLLPAGTTCAQFKSASGEHAPSGPFLDCWTLLCGLRSSRLRPTVPALLDNLEEQGVFLDNLGRQWRSMYPALYRHEHHGWIGSEGGTSRTNAAPGIPGSRPWEACNRKPMAGHRWLEVIARILQTTLEQG